MMNIAVPQVTPPVNSAFFETLKQMADIHDEQSHAVTLYFDRSTFLDRTHREETITIENLVKTARDKLQSGNAHRGVLQDLTRILEMEPQMRSSPVHFKAIFACDDRKIWQEIDLPTCGNVSRLEISQRFQVVPLLRALEACTPYCAAIVEHGKARIFTIRGAEIHELDRLPSADLAVHADDSRVGWSHHIDANVRERAKAYFKALSSNLYELVQALPGKHLVIGCREDLWSELEPQIDEAGLKPMISRCFHLSSFDMTPNEVVLAARPVFAESKRQQYADFWEGLRNTSDLGAISVEPVLRELESGRVQTLFLGDLSGRSVTECSNCHKWINGNSNISICPACGSSCIDSLPAEELLLRKALSTGVNIIAPDHAMAALFGEVGAALRY